MGKARRIVLKTRVFEKVGDATDFFRDMLNRYTIGDRISDGDAEHLKALLERHDEGAEKEGLGIDYFEVGFAPDNHPGQCFWIVRVDGSKIDFSIGYCLKRKPYD